MLRNLPPLFRIFLGYEGRKTCLGAWLISMALWLFLDKLIPLNTFESFVTGGCFLYAGGNIADKWFNLKAAKTDAPLP